MYVTNEAIFNIFCRTVKCSLAGGFGVSFSDEPFAARGAAPGGLAMAVAAASILGASGSSIWSAITELAVVHIVFRVAHAAAYFINIPRFALQIERPSLFSPLSQCYCLRFAFLSCSFHRRLRLVSIRTHSARPPPYSPFPAFEACFSYSAASRSGVSLSSRSNRSSCPSSCPRRWRKRTSQRRGILDLGFENSRQ